MSLATLSIDLEARLASLQQGFDRATRLAEKHASDVEARYNKLISTAGQLGAALAGAFTVQQAYGWMRATLEGLDALNDLADATGASVENLSALEDAAVRTGTAMDVVGSAVVKLNAYLSAAQAGSSQDSTLKRIGLDAEALRRQDPAEALQAVAKALAQYADDGDKARLVQELFGKSVKEVAPLLKDLVEVGRLNATVTSEQAEAAGRLNKEMASLQKSAIDLSRQVAGPLVSALNSFFDTAARAKTAGFDNFFDAALSFNTTEIGRLDKIDERLRAIVTRYRDVNSMIEAATAAGRKPPPELVNRLAELERQERYLRLLQKGEGKGRGGDPRLFAGDERPSVGPVLPPGKPAPASRPTKPQATDYAGTVLDPLTVAALKRLESTDAARLGQLRLELVALLDLQADPSGQAVQTVLDEIERLDPAQRAAAESAARLNQLLADTPTGQMAQVLADIELVNNGLQVTEATAQQWAEAMRGITARLSTETRTEMETMSEFTKQFQSNVQNLLGDNLGSVLRGEFEGIADAWKNMLLNMAAQAIAADLSARLFGPGGNGGGWLSSLGGLLGFAKGGAFLGGQQVTAFADGGVLTRPTMFGMGGGRMGVAGEAGYEGILPLRHGPDGKLGVIAHGGGGGGAVTNIYNVAAGVSRGELVNALQLMSQQTEARVMQRLAVRRVV
jgi:hypothetical protein